MTATVIYFPQRSPPGTVPLYIEQSVPVRSLVNALITAGLTLRRNGDALIVVADGVKR